MTQDSQLSKVNHLESLQSVARKKVVTITSEESGTLVTAVLCMSAEGRYVPPVLIIPCVCSKPEFSDGTVTVFHLSGWTQREIFT